jgi:large subunit ribosomal protein L4
MASVSIKTNNSAKSYDCRGKEVGVVELSPAVFAGPVKRELLHGVVRWQRARSRAGTHSVLTRSEMVGGKKKPFKQKGTGRARAGSSVSPIWVGGAVVHGPTPRSYEFSIPKKMRAAALRSALSTRGRTDSILVLDSLAEISGKTQQAVELLNSLGVAGKKVLVVVPNTQGDACQKLVRALGNVQRVGVMPVQGVNVYDILNSDYLIIVKEALPELEARSIAQ